MFIDLTTQSSIYYILCFCYIIIMFYKSKFAGFSKYHDNFLSLENTKSLRGIVSIAIFVHNYADRFKLFTNHYLLQQIFNNSPATYVGIFFFLSGYGIMKGFNTKKNYSNFFLLKRLPSIIIPQYTSYIFYFFAIFYIGRGSWYTDRNPRINPHVKESFNSQKKWIFTTIFSITIPNSCSWYIISVIWYYIIFYILYKFIKRDWLKFLILIILTIVNIRTGFGYAPKNFYWFTYISWHKAPLNFTIGLIFARYETIIITVYKKYYYCFLLFFSSTLIFGYNILKTHSKYDKIKLYYYYILANNIIGLSGVQVILLFLMKFQLNNFILSDLGEISAEIYLLQKFFICGLRNKYVKFTNKGINMIVTLIVIISVARYVHQLNKFLVGQVKKLVDKYIDKYTNKKINHIKIEGDFEKVNISDVETS